MKTNLTLKIVSFEEQMRAMEIESVKTTEACASYLSK